MKIDNGQLWYFPTENDFNVSPLATQELTIVHYQLSIIYRALPDKLEFEHTAIPVHPQVPCKRATERSEALGESQGIRTSRPPYTNQNASFDLRGRRKERSATFPQRGKEKNKTSSKTCF